MPAPAVRAAAALELALGAVALAVSSTLVAAAVALSYAVFAGVTTVALVRRVPIDTCGCLGRIETPPSWRHLLVLAVAGCGALAATLDPQPALLEQLGEGTSGILRALAVVGATVVAIGLLRAGRRPSSPTWHRAGPPGGGHR